MAKLLSLIGCHCQNRQRWKSVTNANWDEQNQAVIEAARLAITATGYGTITLEVKDGQVVGWDVRITGKCKREKEVTE